MKAVFHDLRITGLVGILPETSVNFEDEVDNYTFPPKQTLRLQKVMGYKSHRIVKPDTATSDLCVAGLDHLFDRGLLHREEIGSLIVATALPDNFIPPVSSILHGRYGLDKDVFCLDISQGCNAFLMALAETFMLFPNLEPGQKAVVIAADVLSRKVSKRDRNSYPLIGDGAGIAVVERIPDSGDVYMRICNDGGRSDALKIPAGGSRMPCTAETAVFRDSDGDGNLRASDNLIMKGSEVFTFVQTEVPPLIESILSDAHYSKEEIDWYLFHQPNRFMLRKLAEKLGVPYAKMPMDIVENYGNSSGACIPINIAYSLGEKLAQNEYRCCLSAFGSGLTWSAMIMNLGKVDFCELVESSC